MRKIFIAIGILFVAMIGMAYLYFANLNIETNVNDLSLNTITKKSGLVFCFENDKGFYDILSGQDLLENVIGEQKSKQIHSLKTNLLSNQEIFASIEKQKIYIGIVPGLPGKTDFLIAIQSLANVNPEKLFTVLSKKAIITNQGGVHQITFKDSTVVFAGFKDQLIVISNSAKEITEALTTSEETNVNFINYIKANSRFNKNTLASLFIDYNKTPVFLKNILNSNINGELNVFNKQDSYAALSYNFSKEQLLFNGTTSVNNANNYYALFSDIDEQKITITNLLPDKTANYTAFAIKDYPAWREKLKAQFIVKKQEEKVTATISRINQQYRLDLDQIFPKYFKDQFITFQLNTGEKFGAIALSNGDKVNQLLLDLGSEYATDIQVFKERDILYSYFGDPFKKFERPFYTVIDNYLVVSNYASSIQFFLNSYKNNSLLVNDNDYQVFRSQLSPNATIAFYIGNKNSNDIFGRNLKTPYYKQYKKQNGFKEYSAFYYQLSGDQGKFLTNILLFKNPLKIVQADTIIKP